MNDIINLIKSLSKKELSILDALYEVEEYSKTSKKYILLNHIKTGKVTDDETACVLIYGKKSAGPKYSRLKSRLTKDILSVMAIEQGKNLYSSAYFIAKHETRQLVLDSEILYGKGHSEIAYKYLKKAYNKALEFELTHEILLILDLLQKHVGQIKGLKYFEQYSKEKYVNLHKLKLKYDSYQTYYEIMLPNIFSGRNINSSLDNINAIINLENIYKESKSREVLSLLLRAKTFFYHQEKSYDLALEAAKEYLKLVIADPIVKSLANEAGANMQISIIELYQSKLNDAMGNINKALTLFNKKSTNELRALNIKFIILSIMNDLNGMDMVLRNVNLNPNLKIDLYQRDLWFLRKATYLFQKGTYQESMAYIQKCNDIISDKSGWRIGIKLLEIICIIELRLYDFLEFRLENFYRLLLSTKELKKGRVMHIYKLLKVTYSNNYNWTKIDLDSNNEYQQLLMQTNEMQWDPLGFEVIPFHRWFSSKK